MVLLHTLQHASLHRHVPFLLYVLGNGGMGVQIFFVISGFLITTLLLREHEKSGRIRLGAFYVRRAFRILPPLYFYICVIALLGVLGRVHGLTGRNLLLAFTLMQNYVHTPTIWPFEHFWSLNIEEQFYFLWPGVLVFCLLRWRERIGRERAAYLALVVALVQPVLRVIYFRLFPNPHFYNMFHLASDALMYGAITALLQGTSAFEAVYRQLTRLPFLLPLVLFFVLGALDLRYGNYFHLPFGATLESVVIAVWLLWLARNPGSLQGRAFNQGWIMWVGRLSYSMYLWQTFFLHADNTSVFDPQGMFRRFPFKWIAILATAVFSYYVVEQPSLRLRDAFMKKLRWRAA